jgi:hypothetical protein
VLAVQQAVRRGWLSHAMQTSSREVWECMREPAFPKVRDPRRPPNNSNIPLPWLT